MLVYSMASCVLFLDKNLLYIMRAQCLFSESCYFRIVGFSVQLFMRKFHTTKGTRQDESDLKCLYMVEWEKLSDKNSCFDIEIRKLGPLFIQEFRYWNFFRICDLICLPSSLPVTEWDENIHFDGLRKWLWKQSTVVFLSLGRRMLFH